MKQIIIISIMLLAIFASGCSEVADQKAANKCEPNYVLHDSTNRLTEDVLNDNGTVGYRFFKEHKCLDGSTPQLIGYEDKYKHCMDCPSTRVLYCEVDNNFAVVRHDGHGGVKYYFFEGKPCK